MKRRNKIDSKQPGSSPNEHTGLMKIGQLAHASETSKSTIHHYVNLGLLPPPFKKHSRVHLFSNDHLSRLQIIRRLRKEKKLSLASIKVAFDNGDLQRAFHETGTPDDFSSLNKNSFKHIDRAFNDERGEILDAAVVLFSQNDGIVRIDDIAKSALVPKTAIYQHFSSKNDLFANCIDRLSDTVVIPAQKLEEINKETNVCKRFHKKAVAFWENFQHFKNILNLSRMVLPNKDAELRESAKKAFKNIADTFLDDIKTAQMKRCIRNINPEILSFFLIGITEFLGHMLSMDPNISLQKTAAMYLDFIQFGLMERPGSDASGTNSVMVAGDVLQPSGTKIRVKNIIFNDQNFLPAKIADANLKIDIRKVLSITIRPGNPSCTAFIKMNAGGEMKVDIDPSDKLSGETIMGPFEIQINKIAKILFN